MKKYITITLMALLLITSAMSVQAAPPGHKATIAPSLRLFHGRLTVVDVTAPDGHIGLRNGDQIIAVNGQRVSTEAAFRKRLSMTRNGPRDVRITINRNQLRDVLSVPASPGNGPRNRSQANNASRSGFINPDLLVVTSQGVMHRETAERLGLPYTPFVGSPEYPNRGR